MFKSKSFFVASLVVVLQGCTTTPIVDANGNQVVDKDGNPMQRTCIGLPCLLHKEFGDYSVPIASVKINKEGVSASAGGSQQSINGMPVMSPEDMQATGLHSQQKDIQSGRAAASISSPPPTTSTNSPETTLVSTSNSDTPK